MERVIIDCLRIIIRYSAEFSFPAILFASFRGVSGSIRWGYRVKLSKPVRRSGRHQHGDNEEERSYRDEKNPQSWIARMDIDAAEEKACRKENTGANEAVGG